LAEEKRDDEKEFESKDKEEDEEIESILEELEAEELETDLNEQESIISTNLEQITENKIEMSPIQSEEIIEDKRNFLKTEVTVEKTPIIAEIEQRNKIEQSTTVEKKDALETEPLMAEQAIDEIEKVQDESVKEKFRDLPGYIEALLFEIGKPLKEAEIVELLYDKFKADRLRIRWGLRKVMRALEAQNSSIQLINPTKDFWSFQLNRNLPDDFLSKIEKFIPEEEFISKRETQFLTEIAYRQPVSTTEILRILGADGYEYIRSLEAKDLIYLTKEGQSNILRTTTKFAQLFGFDPELRSLKIQLVWRLKKLARSEAARDKDMLAQLKKDREKYSS